MFLSVVIFVCFSFSFHLAFHACLRASVNFNVGRKNTNHLDVGGSNKNNTGVLLICFIQSMVN